MNQVLTVYYDIYVLTLQDFLTLQVFLYYDFDRCHYQCKTWILNPPVNKLISIAQKGKSFILDELQDCMNHE